MEIVSNRWQYEQCCRELSILVDETNEKAKILAEESDSAAVYCTQLKVYALDFISIRN